MIKKVTALLALCCAVSQAVAQDKPKMTYPEEVSEITIQSSADSSAQKALWWAPDDEKLRPLLVALHTWSGNYKQAGGETVYARWCLDNDWIFIHPDFRGVNQTPPALGSDLAVADILDSVEYAKKHAKVDTDRIYMIGVSGGGHASLLMAGRHPEIWAGVSAWCGISDLKAWHDKHAGTRYGNMMEKACGGPPSDPAAAEQYTHRSPNTWLANARGKVALDIAHGVTDGRSGSVPFTHSLTAFNLVAVEDARLSKDEINAFYQSQKATSDNAAVDPLYGEEPLPFRRESETARITVFNGGHEIVHRAGLNWLAQQRRSNEKPVWNLDPAQIRKLSAPAASESGK